MKRFSKKADFFFFFSQINIKDWIRTDSNVDTDHEYSDLGHLSLHSSKTRLFTVN